MADQRMELPKRHWVNRYLPILLLAPTLCVLAGVTIYPLIYNIWLSFMRLTLTDPTAGAVWIGGRNWLKVFTSNLTRNAFLNTLIFTSSAVGAEFVLALAIALLLNRPFFGKKVVFPGLLLPIMMAPVACGLTWKYMYNAEFGIIAYFLRTLGFQTFALLSSRQTALLGVIIQDIWHWTPFLMLIFYSGLLSLPREPYEAAMVDGSTRWQILKNVTLPLMRPFFLIGILLRTMDAFKVFDEIYMMTQGGPGDATEVVNMYVYRQTFRYFSIGDGAAMAVVILGIIIILSNLFVVVFKEKVAEE